MAKPFVHIALKGQVRVRNIVLIAGEFGLLAAQRRSIPRIIIGRLKSNWR